MKLSLENLTSTINGEIQVYQIRQFRFDGHIFKLAKIFIKDYDYQLVGYVNQEKTHCIFSQHRYSTLSLIPIDGTDTKFVSWIEV